MEPKTLKALKASIEKWEKNVRARGPGSVLLGTEHCPLCQVFYNINGNCYGCPIERKVKNELCDDTPYGKAAGAWSQWDFNRDVTSRKAWQAAAQAEVDFLKSLLPEGETND